MAQQDIWIWRIFLEWRVGTQIAVDDEDGDEDEDDDEDEENDGTSEYEYEQIRNDDEYVWIF